ncbi:MAG TPA: acyl-CoA dehydrogenase family protein, partial [Thermoanaerobaculia bacterium]
MTTTIETTPGAPLTLLSEEEQMFQQSVRDFAVEKIRPLVHQMDHDAAMSKDLIQNFFELGI